MILEANLSYESDTLVIQDRGLFDALAFLKLLHLDGYISDEAFKAFSDYFAQPMSLHLTNLVILFEISPEKALERDLAERSGAPPGIITNIATSQNLSLAYEFVLNNMAEVFQQ